MAPFLAHLSRLLQQTRIPAHPRIATGVVACAATAGCIVWLLIRNRRPSAIELERRRREHLTLNGRITDGSIVDARSHDGAESISPTPDLLLFRYRIAGVTYDCAQDVSLLPECTAGYRIDQPVQVRYDPRNPGNSIIVSEDWTGLRMKPQRVLPFETNAPHSRS
ncbi:MAG TPA: DUF3592 domain-containing protein [Acidobacteriaceae bacterium]